MIKNADVISICLSCFKSTLSFSFFKFLLLSSLKFRSVQSDIISVLQRVGSSPASYIDSRETAS